MLRGPGRQQRPVRVASTQPAGCPERKEVGEGKNQKASARLPRTCFLEPDRVGSIAWYCSSRTEKLINTDKPVSSKSWYQKSMAYW